MNDGSFLVSDGYCNSRVMRFNPDGSYHSQYELPKGSSFIGVAHSLVLDECDGEVLLADREGMMVHKWDLNTRQLIGKAGRLSAGWTVQQHAPCMIDMVLLAAMQAAWRHVQAYELLFDVMLHNHSRLVGGTV
eukprot:GHRR01037402.1.p1 GENE.GHRR01037402.1~~GHRR01037402.1.p1  ORF type:complete len:133 (-),score=34.84 GHRR01037402.1:30-428(-)